MPAFEDLRDASPASIMRLNDMLRWLYEKVQGGITRAELSPELIEDISTVDGDKLVDNAITGDKIGDGQIAGGHIEEASIGTAHIQEAAITNAKIDRLSADALTVTTADIEDLAVDEGRIANLAVTSAKIDALAVKDAHISDLSANKLTAGTIDADVIDVENLHAENITVGTINGYQISQGAITGGPGGNIAPGTITGQNIKYIEADYIRGGDLTLGGAVNESTYNGRIIMKRADGTVYGEHNRDGLFHKDNGGNIVLAVREDSLYFKDSSLKQYTDGTRTGPAIFPTY